MEYKIIKEQSFIVIMQEIQLREHKRQNMKLTTNFWLQFNKHLKLSRLSQSGNWIKYAFMIRQEGTLMYGCAIPYRGSVPNDFLYKEIPAHTYMVVEHVGSMNTIYVTYDKIYKEILPNSEYSLDQNDFLHFEKYDHRFHWNRVDSIIEIWIPIS